MEAAYPHLASVIPHVREIVKQSRNNSCKDSELEIRFGRFVNGEYVSGVSRDFMDGVLTMIQTNTDFVATDWCEFHDFTYKLTNGKDARTRVSFDTDDLVVQTVTAQKHKISQAIFKDVATDHALRMSYSREIPVANDNIPTLVNTDLVRIQQRRSFIYEKCWSFDFSLTWQGKTKTEAEQRQQSVDPVFEVEIELIDNAYVQKHDDSWIAVSFLLKALDFLPKTTELSLHKKRTDPHA